MQRRSSLPTRLRLVTIPYSHFCEKARWALDHCGLVYDEEPHLPFISRLAGIRHRFWHTVPVLLVEGRPLAGSSAILRFADQHAPPARRLLPDAGAAREEADAFERRLDESFGPHARRFAYSLILDGGDDLVRLLGRGAPRPEAALLPLLTPLIRAAVRRGLGVTAAGARRSRAVVDELFAAIAARLGDGRRYLLGDRFSSLDLAFAALATAVVIPPGFDRLPADDELPAAALPEVRRLRATPAGQFVLRLYRDHRRSTAIAAAAGRDIDGP